MVVVRLENLKKYFVDRGKIKRAVDGINLTIKDGEFLVLLGPSGCGKTTTLRCIAGLWKPTDGRIYFDERDVTYLPPKDRNVSMVFQSYAVWPHMKVYENIAFPLEVKKYPKEEIDEKVKWAAELLQIDTLLDRYPGQLSGGQRQRVAVARAIVIEPEVLLMDEPLSNLDARLRVMMRAEIKKLQTRLKVTTIYVTHDQVEAMTMGDRIAVMNEGRLLQVASPSDIYLKPKLLFVASFIGAPEINLLEATVKENGSTLVLEGEGFKLPLTEEFTPLLKDYVDKSVIVGVRPEHLMVEGISDISRIENKTQIKGTVDFVEALGTDTIVHANVGGKIVKVKIPGVADIPIGREIKIIVDLDRLHVFDKRTERAIV